MVVGVVRVGLLLSAPVDHLVLELSAFYRAYGAIHAGVLVALVESVLHPGGWENMCHLMCHCVRHIDVDNKHGRSVKAIHSFL